jgi:hypothetical protein
METFDALFSVAPDVPILILGGNLDEKLAKEAVARGALDYLLPDHLDSYSLPGASHGDADNLLCAARCRH